MNGISYINANLPAAQTNFTGADTRPRWTTNRINANVSDTIVLGNQNDGSSWHISASLTKRFKQGMLKGAYSYGESKNTVDPGSIAIGSWTGNAISSDPNNPAVAYSNQFPGHRVFLTGSYRLEYLKFGATTFSFFWQGYTNGVASYTYPNDLNSDLGFNNDLLYIPRDQSEMNFETFAAGGRTYTSAEQAAAWDAYINQDPYLSQHRGEYAVRNARAPADGVPARLQRGAGPLQEPRRRAPLAPVPGRLPELLEPAQPRLGRRPALRRDDRRGTQPAPHQRGRRCQWRRALPAARRQRTSC